MGMKIGRARSCVDQFGLGPETEVEFSVVKDSILLRNVRAKPNSAQMKGGCATSSQSLAIRPCERVHLRTSVVDDYLEDIRCHAGVYGITFGEDTFCSLQQDFGHD